MHVNNLSLVFRKKLHSLSISAGSNTVSCNFEDPHICGYTTGSCWNRGPISHADYGKRYEMSLRFCKRIYYL